MSNQEVLPEPLVSADVDLTDFAFMPLDVRRLRDSRLAASSDGEEFRAAVLLWCAAWHQVPAASLPDDDIELAQLAGFEGDATKWKKVRNGALRGWIKCSDGRLYHPLLAEKANVAWTRHHRLRHAAIRKSCSKRIKGYRWTKIRQRILERDGFHCVLCGAIEQLEIDHIKPLAEGGSNSDNNLRVLCMPCNRRKSYKVVA